MHALCVQIRDLRASVSRGEQQAAWREEHMKQEVGALQQRLQEAEMRNQELTTSISQSEWSGEDDEWGMKIMVELL